mgnify:FL=1|jgi:hypothetical protein
MVITLTKGQVPDKAEHYLMLPVFPSDSCRRPEARAWMI